MITALVATFDAKAFNDTESWNRVMHARLAGNYYNFDRRTK